MARITLDKNVYTFKAPQPRVMVASHERSGTHFLMNSMAAAFQYVSDPWIDFDYNTAALNYYSPPSIRDFANVFKPHDIANVLKCHFAADFFDEVIGEVTEVLHILYVYRDPHGVLKSLWKFVQTVPWRAGPETDSLSEFIRAQPCRHLLHYQMRQAPTLLHRWENHVTGWLQLAENAPRVIPVRFEDLRDAYAETVTEIGEKLGLKPTSLEPPAKDVGVILPGTGSVVAADVDYDDDDERFIRDSVGPTLEKLGYA